MNASLFIKIQRKTIVNNFVEKKSEQKNDKTKSIKRSNHTTNCCCHFCVSLRIPAPKVQPALVVPISHAVRVHYLCAQNISTCVLQGHLKNIQQLGVAIQTNEDKRKALITAMRKTPAQQGSWLRSTRKSKFSNEAIRGDI